MKRKIFFAFIILMCILVVGCGKQEEKEDEKRNMLSEWEIVLTDDIIGLDEEEINMFNDACSNYTSLEFDPVALLGTQVVSGTNYMFLAKGYQKGEEEKSTYKIVIIYKNLEGKATITRVNDFDYTKYVNENIDNNNGQLSGRWYTNAPGKVYMLDEEVQEIFDKAMETITGMMYNPIAVVGKQSASGTNYAILCYGRASTNGTIDGVYLLTLYKDLKGTQEIVSHAYINLADFNK